VAIGTTLSAGETVGGSLPAPRVLKGRSNDRRQQMADSSTGRRQADVSPTAGDLIAVGQVDIHGARRDIGFEQIDVGPLAMSRHLEAAWPCVWRSSRFVQKMGRDSVFFAFCWVAAVVWG